jgi:hypothetical protein
MTISSVLGVVIPVTRPAVVLLLLLLLLALPPPVVLVYKYPSVDHMICSEAFISIRDVTSHPNLMRMGAFNRVSVIRIGFDIVNSRKGLPEYSEPIFVGWRGLRLRVFENWYGSRVE